MPRKSRLSIAKPQILEFFRSSPRKVFKQAELVQILEEHREEWQLAANTNGQGFARFLIEEGDLREVKLRSEHYMNIKAERLAWGEPSPYELALSLRSSAYLCHATAVFLHGLTDLLPKTVYVNIEQSPKPAPSGNLTANSIKTAFARKQRQSKLSYRHGDWNIIVISGKNTDQLEVVQIEGPSGERLAATSLERTLIDIVVRPSYAGGIFKVLEAYKTARGRVSVERLVSTLQELGYVYPYHQAIGYLMERAGYDQRDYHRLRDKDSGFAIEHDFYLTHGMIRPNYDQSWQLFFPDGL